MNNAWQTYVVGHLETTGNACHAALPLSSAASSPSGGCAAVSVKLLFINHQRHSRMFKEAVAGKAEPYRNGGRRAAARNAYSPQMKRMAAED